MTESDGDSTLAKDAPEAPLKFQLYGPRIGREQIEPAKSRRVQSDRRFTIAAREGRNVDQARVVSTFNTKIGPAALEDYLFFVNEPSETEDARAQAGKYFSQGSEVNFVDIRTWTRMTLVTMGKGGRAAFNASLTELLSGDDMPRSVKLGWNNIIDQVTSI